MRKNDLLYPELSFRINGVLFEVYRQMGGGHHEKYYQKAVVLGLLKEKIKFREQVYVPLKFNDKIVGKYFLDFLIEDKIILELKRGKMIPILNLKQTKQYLSTLNLKLGIVASFTQEGVVIKRIINEY